MYLKFCSPQAHMARERDTFVDLSLQESNAKTELEVWDAPRIIPMVYYILYQCGIICGSRRRQRKPLHCEALLTCETGRGKKIVWESQSAQRGAAHLHGYHNTQLHKRLSRFLNGQWNQRFIPNFTIEVGHHRVSISSTIGFKLWLKYVLLKTVTRLQYIIYILLMIKINFDFPHF